MKLMKKRGTLILVVCCAFVASLLMGMPIRAAEEDAIVGTVVAASTDANGKVTAIKIETDEGDYAVAGNDKAKELMALIDKDVEVTGTVKESGGKKIITVTSFEVIAE
jgi:hypothetical protein